MLRQQNAIHTLIHQRHLTPSCGGPVPTAERALNPARMFADGLTPGPELENAIMRRARPYRGENPDPGKDAHGGLTPRPELENSQDPKRKLPVNDIYVRY
jgi:hypothetical protein